jgi:hypothetical protein
MLVDINYVLYRICGHLLRGPLNLAIGLLNILLGASALPAETDKTASLFSL